MAPARDDLFHRIHQPVMVREVLHHLFDGAEAPRRRLVVDGTVGLGGHAEAVLDDRPDAEVVGLDRDPEALVLARERLAPYGPRFRGVNASFADVEGVLRDFGEDRVFAVLLDLGLSSLQVDRPERGFSFQAGREGADMRFDQTAEAPTALDLANTLSESTLAQLLAEYGEEPRARAVARRIVRARPLRDGAHLASVVREAALRTRRHDPATRTFQALRIAVNDEMGHLERGLAAALRVVEPGGRIVVIAFHSGEDRRVKQTFQRAAREGWGRLRTRKPQRPGDAEVRENRRARPARLRAIERAGGARDS